MEYVTVKAKKFISVLDSDHAGRDSLCIRNESLNPQGIPSGPPGQSGFEVALEVLGEVIVPNAAPWVASRILREVERSGRVSLHWVDADYQPRRLPRIEDAPEDSQPDGTYPYDKTYALDILMSDEATALEMIGYEVTMGDGTPDLRYLKQRFARVLKFVLFAEPKARNRRKVLRAADTRLQDIRAL